MKARFRTSPNSYEQEELRSGYLRYDECASETSLRHASDPLRRSAAQAAARRMTEAVHKLASILRAQLDNKVSVTPSLRAIIDGEERVFPSLKEKIDALEESWRAHQGGRSRTEYNHFSYFQIVGSGPFALPILLEKVKAGSNAWFVALKAISGENVDTPAMQGKPSEAREAWVSWGDRNVYSGEASVNMELATQWPYQPRLEPGRLGDSE